MQFSNVQIDRYETCLVFQQLHIVRQVMHIQLLIEGQQDQRLRCIPKNDPPMINQAK